MPSPGLFRRESDRTRGWKCSSDKLEPVDLSLQSHGDIPLVSIFTLGRFSLLLNGMPAEFGRKAPKRPLELLKAVIALGSRDISTVSLMSALWPDVDGDAAQRSFDTTLHRLRKVLGDERVLQLNDGKLTLDGRYCWVDVWSFERLLGQVNRLLAADIKGEQADVIKALSGKLLTLYQNHFLSVENTTSWSVSLQERLRSKYIFHLLEIGRYMERNGRTEFAMHYYRKGIDTDDLVEVFYQRMMQCCIDTQHYSEGMSVYRRCRQVLSIVLGLQPEALTDSLYRTLCKTRNQQQSA